MNFRLIKSKESGFSLIELMVVVAIIGILASLALPNFQRFQNKAKQSEAKEALAAIVTGEKAFQSEWQTYVGDLRDIGLIIEGKRRYNVGFSADFNSGSPPVSSQYSRISASGATAGNCSSVAGTNGTSLSTACWSGAGYASGVTSLPAATGSVFQTTFTASAGGYVSGASSGTADAWTIDQNGNMSNTTSGI